MYRHCGTFDDTYQKDMAIVRTPFHWGVLIAAVVFFYLLPLWGSFYFINFINYANITVIIVLGLQIVSGYCGQVSFGQAAFMAVGAYTSAILTISYGINFWLALPLSGIITGVIGLIGGAPSLRIKGFYLGMASIAIHFLIMWLIIHLSITGGSRGLNPEPPTLGSFAFDTDERMYYVIMTVMVIMTYAARNLLRCKVGRTFIAIRDNDLAAEVMGVNLFYYKLLAFYISCFYAGVGGALWAHWITVVHPEQFTLLQAIWYIGMLIVGGMGSIPGVFFGVVSLRLLDEGVMLISPILASKFPLLGLAPAASLGVTAFGLMMAIFLVFEPRGLAHRWEIVKSSLRLYPFSN